uniref:WD repeat-containing protein 75 second beta-propeller domain-containing protein n=2 Tax=Cuerna arida TaxID=1464854 RepID=A0A1B6FIN3_9HEMI
MVITESLQIIDKPMDEKIVVRNKGGGCIVKHPPLFSSDGKYVYILCGWCVSAYSVQTGECAFQFQTESREELVSIATYGDQLCTVTASGKVMIWKSSTSGSRRQLKLALEDNFVVAKLFTVASENRARDFDFVVAVRRKDMKDLHLWLYSAKSGKAISNIYVCADDKPHSVSVCDQFVATIKHDRLTAIAFDRSIKKYSTLAGSDRLWNVIACAPEAKGLAAGDNTGRILFWPQPFFSQARAVFHWHTLPVLAITFSASGSYMYSGGGEGVMVRWNVEVSNVRNFLPRLPAPIVHLNVSPDNQHVAIATQDNGVQLADSQNRVTSVIQKMSWGLTPVEGTPLVPAGLVWDPLSRSIVLNGRPGHLQFFNTDDNKLLYNLDITGQNYLTQERHKDIINAEVTQVAVSHDGKWMVTVETRDDHEYFFETLLKFWQYKFNARQFSLNTCIQLPHQGQVNAVKFQPAGAFPDQYLLVTTGADCKFRTWVPSVSDSIHSEGLRWTCDSIGQYRTQPAHGAAFSADGSVLGVTFGPSLTLWDTETTQLITSLTRDNSTLRAIEFGTRECCHLVVTAGDSHLIVWNLLILRVAWSLPLGPSLLCSDPLSSHMAVFTPDSSVFVFSPSDPKPVYERHNLCSPGTSVLAAIFVPRSHVLADTSAPWCAHSQLHFIDSNQELQYLELESERDPEQSYGQSSSLVTPVTPFSILTARKSSSAVDRLQASRHEQFGTAGDTAVRKLLRNPAHTMPHIHLFCKSFMKSLSVSRETGNEKRQNDEEDPEEIQKMDVDEDSDASVKTSEPESPTKIYNRTSSNDINANGEEGRNSPKKGIKEVPSKTKQRRRSNKERKSPTKKNSFSFDDLDTDWLSLQDNR